MCLENWHRGRVSRHCEKGRGVNDNCVEKTGISSVQFSRLVVSDSLRPHESQHARPPCPSPSPGVHSDSRPSSQWRHPAISSSVVPFSSCPQSLPASESFPMSQLFTWGGQSTGVRPFRYDLNQIPYDYTVEVRNRFKSLDLIECLMNYGMRFVTWYRRQGSRPSLWKRNAKKQNGCLGRHYK